jgi:hypothetical protein
VPAVRNGAETKSRYEISVDLVKALIWPLLIAIFFISYRQPISQTVQQIPSLLASSSELTIAGTKIQIDRRLRARTSTAVLQAMSQLSPDGMERLMDMVRGTPVFGEKAIQRYRDEWQETISLGLVEITPWHGSDPEHAYGLRVTSLGRDVQQLVFVLLSEITGRLTTDVTAADTPPK